MIRNDNYRKLSRILSICDTDKLVRIQNGSTRGRKQDSGFPQSEHHGVYIIGAK